MGRVVVALGGNALLKRGEDMTADNQRRNARLAAETLAPLCLEHQTVITHGNGPQVGLLALQELAYEGEDYPLDVLGAETVGMIGYMIEQELGNFLPFEKPIATLLTMVEVDPNDPAFKDPTKFIGKVYTEEEAHKEAKDKGWQVKPDGKFWRRVVPSPLPRRIFQLRPITWLLEKGSVVIAAGGGGIPTMYEPGKDRHLIGVECVVDKDRASALLAKEIGADVFVVATDADAVYVDWGKPSQKAIRSATADAMDRYSFPAGSMGPKVEAVQDFARSTGKRAVICALPDILAAIKGEKGTTVAVDAGEILLDEA
jgi:carbamate kinase